MQIEEIDPVEASIEEIDPVVGVVVVPGLLVVHPDPNIDWVMHPVC